ncbi:MAG: molybdopterin molybdenumtransferase MoeA [Frankiales bacterium]|nr:molybdopterin molybdenumtransferase MoeA [Frankiales bacterium]
MRTGQLLATWAQARQRAYEAAAPLAGEARPLSACAGTVLAAPLVARSPLPPYDVSAMDGFAVAGPGPWRLLGEVLAGATWGASLTDGTAVGIATGALLPPGCTAVLQVERAQVGDGLVRGEVEPGRHVRRAGEECAAGEHLLDAGSAVTAAVLGLAAACGHDALDVHPRPRVAALVTGDELLASGLPHAGRIRDALGPQLPLLVAAHGGDVVELAHLPDEEALLRQAVEAASCDVVVITGATSVGPADHLRPVLTALGAELLVDGVACRPGHPQVLARLPDGRFVVGLPGNPLAALVATVTVLGPLLAALAGRGLRHATALLGEELRAAPDSTRLVPVRLDGTHAHPVRHTGSGMLRGAAEADALAVVPPGPSLQAGDAVEILPLP